MNSTAQTVAIVLSIISTYIWLSIPDLQYYAPQLAAGLILGYFLLRLARKKHLLPLSLAKSTPEFALVSGSVLLLIGSTGNLDSLFFPLAYLHIFFLTMSLKPVQSIGLSIALLVFHYSLMTTVTTQHVSTLFSVFLLLFIFLFAKKQYEEHMHEELVVEKQQQELSEQQSNAILFVTTFLKPKLDNLLRLSDYPEANKEVIQRQLIIIQDAVEELLQVVHPNQK